MDVCEGVCEVDACEGVCERRMHSLTHPPNHSFTHSSQGGTHGTLVGGAQEQFLLWLIDVGNRTRVPDVISISYSDAEASLVCACRRVGECMLYVLVCVPTYMFICM